jgi:hypothetical protein
MNKTQLTKLLATEKKIETPSRKEYWHYRRSPATRYRDAVWQYANRPTDGIWEEIPTPSMEVLERLESKGSTTRDGTRWQGFHDPDEYEMGF